MVERFFCEMRDLTQPSLLNPSHSGTAEQAAFIWAIEAPYITNRSFPVESTPSSLMYDVMGGGVRRLCGDGDEVVLINKCLWGSPRSLLPVTRPGGSCIWYEVWYIGVGISVLVFMYATF
jgi:hypothetical protein